MFQPLWSPRVSTSLVATMAGKCVCCCVLPVAGMCQSDAEATRCDEALAMIGVWVDCFVIRLF
jgi:hypothetical protein